MDFPNETSEQLTSYILNVLKIWSIEHKLIALSADNTNTNFGGSSRRGKNNVYSRLKDSIGNDLIGIGCSAHIINNNIHTAADTCRFIYKS
jgi:hypothetical protein